MGTLRSMLLLVFHVLRQDMSILFPSKISGEIKMQKEARQLMSYLFLSINV
jgi:hypothetical protein